MPTTDVKTTPTQGPNRPLVRTSQPQNLTEKKSSTLSFIITFIIMLGFWLLFSGRFDLFHILMGVVSCLFVSAISSRLLFSNALPSGLLKCWLKFAAYLPWLFFQIFLANLHVLYLSFHPRMMDLINPKIIEFDSRLKSDVSRTTFANSITLTPGTITIYAGIMGTFAVHCINDKSGQDLPGEMESKIAKVFDE
ncbi:MAG: Na+/H+ antiporter subunit E [Deltaproteobacteria bacterium]|nr:Na+/H+ antiporter subunit E [Deltaproteobacteria bacterium]